MTTLSFSGATLRMFRLPTNLMSLQSPFVPDGEFEDPGWGQEQGGAEKPYSFYQGRTEVARALLQRDARTAADRRLITDEMLYGGAIFSNPRPKMLLSFFEVRRSLRGKGIGTAAATLLEAEHKHVNLYLLVETEAAKAFWEGRGWIEAAPPTWLREHVLTGMSKSAQ